ncbi:glycosyltransferase [Streptomyces sp. CA-294286]|uniref:glycosyltransferase n=1 Tax=Streptomyces sp. CA-294286 TaxID=3240070 RepID=UPI003D8A7C7E
MADSMTARDIFLVGFDVDSLGGSQRVLHTLAQGMGDRGHRVRLVGLRKSPEPFPYNAAPSYKHSTLYSLPARPAWRPRTLTERLNSSQRRAAKEARVDRQQARSSFARMLGEAEKGFVIFGSPWAVDWGVGMDWGRFKRVGQYHESFEQARTSANLRLIKKHYPALDKTLVLSDGDAREFRNQRIPNVSVMPNPLPFYPDEPASLDTLRIGAVGRFEQVKRIDRLLEAFAKAAPGRPGWELHLFGDGPLENMLRDTAARLGVARQVVFRGTATSMQSVYAELSAVVISSEREGRPMALAEAAACGVPCVSFDLSGGVRELVKDGVTGTLVPSGDIQGLAAAMGALMDDEKMRRAYGAAARDHVADLALPRVLDRWETLFAQVER